MKALRMTAAAVVLVCGMVYLFGVARDAYDKRRLEYLTNGVNKDGVKRSPAQWDEVFRERDEIRNRHPEWKR